MNVGFIVYDSTGTVVTQGNPAKGGASPDVPIGSDLTSAKNAYVSLPRRGAFSIQVYSYDDRDVGYTVIARYRP